MSGYASHMLKLSLMVMVLLVIWVALAGNLAIETIAIGAVTAVASTVVFRDLIAGRRWFGRDERLRDPHVGKRSLGQRLKRVGWIILFGPVFVWKVLLSGIDMAGLALKPSIDFWPGIVRVEGKLNTLTGTALFSNLLTLTPGTMTIDYDETDDALYVHWIDLTGYGEKDFDRRVTSGLRKWMHRIEA